MKETPAPLSVRTLYASLAQLLLGYVFASSGLCKLTGGAFGQVIGPPTADMVPGLASIWPFLACSQVLAGALVLSGRWSLLGLVMLLPLNTGILAYTTANQWAGTPFVNALLLTLNILALLNEWPTLRVFLQPDAVPAPLRGPRLFPGRWLPATVLLALGGALASALGRAPIAVVTVLGAAGFALAWRHVAFGTAGIVPRLLLALSGVAVLLMTATGVAPRMRGLGNVVAAAVALTGLLAVAYGVWMAVQARRASPVRVAEKG